MFQRRRNNLLLVIVFFIIGCEERYVKIFSQDISNVSVVSGDLFLSGPDKQRFPFTISGQQALPLLRLLETAKPVCDLKLQGIAALHIVYLDGNSDGVEITNTGLFRVKHRPYIVDIDALRQHLNIIMEYRSTVPEIKSFK